MAANDIQIGGEHYKGEWTQQHWDYAWEHGYDQFQYCVTKYVDRHKYKNGLQDLYKARHHLDKYIELLEAEEVDKKQLLMQYEEEMPPREYVNPDCDQMRRASGGCTDLARNCY